MKAVWEVTQTIKIFTISTTIGADDNEDSDLPLETLRSHIELSKDHQVAFGVIHLNQAAHINGVMCTDYLDIFPTHEAFVITTYLYSMTLIQVV